jgi:3-oxoacyl-[acyl-carrier protein] reductase
VFCTITNKENLLPFIPLKRFGQPEEVASLVKFLALDPAGGYMTGHAISIDGGMATGAT